MCNFPLRPPRAERRRALIISARQQRFNPAGLDVSQIKEECSMKYEKPKLTKASKALKAIQNHQKKPGSLFADNMIVPFVGTTNAYQADE
jgi:hypothetical protein